jgi:hypothetical protein
MSGSFDTWPLIRADAMDRAEEETGLDVSEFFGMSARAGDRAYQELLNYKPWLFARAATPLMLRLYGPIATTLTWSSGYTAILGAVVAQNLTGFKILAPGVTYGVRIFSHVAGSALVTLESPFLIAPFAGLGVTVYRDEYDLTSIQETPTAPTLTSGGGGLVDLGPRSVVVSFGNDFGENMAGPPASITFAVASVLNITNIPVGPPGTTYRNLYATEAGGTRFFLIATLADNVTTTYAYNVADAGDLVTIGPITAAQRPPQLDTAGGVRQIITMQPKGPSSGREIEGPVTVSWLTDHYPDPPNPTWPPYKYARVSDTRLRFSHFPSQDGFVEIYHTIVARDLSQTLGVSEILVPRNWRWVLADGVLFHLLEMKNDSRAVTWERKWKEERELMGADEDQKLLGVSGNRTRTREEPAY